MEINTLIKLGSLALNVLQHQPFRELTSHISKGIHRRMNKMSSPLPPWPVTPPSIPPLFPERPPYPGGFHPYPHARRPTVDPWYGYGQGRIPSRQQMPSRNILQYITPENAKKLLEWHGVIKEYAKLIKP